MSKIIFLSCLIFLSTSTTVLAGTVTRIDQAPQQSASRQWTMHVGSTLIKELENWAKQAGWSVVNLAHWDYPVLANAHWKTPRIEDAIEQVRKSVYASQRKISIRTYSNHVITITDWSQ